MEQRRRLEFAYLADRREVMPLVIDLWRTTGAVRKGSDADQAAEQLIEQDEASHLRSGQGEWSTRGNGGT